MEFKINSKILEKLLAKIIPAVPSRTPMPILENFLFEIKDGSLTVSATDLEIALRSSLNVAAEKNIKIVVPARLLYDIVRSLEDTQVNFLVDGKGKIKITTDKGIYGLSYSPSEDFPEIASVSKEKELIINGNDLKKSLEQTSFAMSKEDMRPAMTGTLVEFSKEGLRFVATDGHRLVKFINKSFASDTQDQYIIPERAISVLLKQLGDADVKIYLSKTYASFIINDLEFISRLIGEKYPSYGSVIPLENENFLTVNRAELLSAVKRMMLFSTSNSKQVKFSISENSLEVSAEDIDHGSDAKENIQCDYKGDPMDIGFNTTYVNDILSHLVGDQVIFKLHSPTKASIIEPVKNNENEDIMMLLMPVRLNN
ncbi:MAG: DNA polymerase III subunit beta [Ignavibacteriales bacterium]|nr:DNA polymerase III subunit beta [Ignavibacteriales bacterium]